MKIDLKGNTYQDSTTGKNVLPIIDGEATYGGITCKIENGKITISGTSNINYVWVKLTNGVELMSGTPSSTNKPSWFSNESFGGDTYSFSKIGTTKAFNCTQVGDTTYQALMTNTQTTKTLDLSNNIFSNVLYYVGANGTTINETFYLQAVKGSTPDTDFEPYTNGASPNPDYPQDIHVVSGDNSIDVCGKNLYNGTYYTKKYINYNIGEMRNSDDWSATDYIEIEPNTNYTLSGITNSGWVAGTSFYDNNKTFISSVFSTIYSFTTPANAKYLRFSMNSETPTNVMLEKGSTATTYEAYKSASYPITLPEGMFLGWIPNTDYRDIIFQAKTGDTYYDSLDSTTKENLTYGKWYLNKQIGKVVLDGSIDESWGLQSINSYGIANFLTSYQGDYPDDITLITSQIVNYFTKQTSLISQTTNEGFLPTRNSTTQRLGVYLRIKQTTASTVQGIRDWLSTHNTIVYYVLKTPTYTEITDSTLLSQLEAINGAKSYTTQTNINQDNNDNASVLNATALSE